MDKETRQTVKLSLETAYILKGEKLTDVEVDEHGNVRQGKQIIGVVEMRNNTVFFKPYKSIDHFNIKITKQSLLADELDDEPIDEERQKQAEKWYRKVFKNVKTGTVYVINCGNQIGKTYQHRKLMKRMALKDDVQWKLHVLEHEPAEVGTLLQVTSCEYCHEDIVDDEMGFF